MTETRRDFLKLAASGLSLSGAAPRSQTSRPPGGDRGADLRARRPGEAVLACAGDWFLTRRLSTAIEPETNSVFEMFRHADAGFANLENGLSTRGSGELGGFRQGPPLRGDPALVSELAWGGVRNVSLANNHTGNFGREALMQTIATLDQAKIGHAGAGSTIDRAFAPAFVTAGDLSVAFFSVYSLYYNFGAFLHQLVTIDCGNGPSPVMDLISHILLSPRDEISACAWSIRPNWRRCWSDWQMTSAARACQSMGLNSRFSEPWTDPSPWVPTISNSRRLPRCSAPKTCRDSR
jgi:hypothetical protein